MNKSVLRDLLLLKQTTHQIQCPPGLQVSAQQFSLTLQHQITRNELDARVELRPVCWDDTEQSHLEVLIEPGESKEFRGVVCYVLGMSNEGVFAHIDEKLALLPPPAVREKQPLLGQERFQETDYKAYDEKLAISKNLTILFAVLAAFGLFVALVSGGSSPAASILLGLAAFAAMFTGFAWWENSANIASQKRSDQERKLAVEAENVRRIGIDQKTAEWNAAADRERAQRDAWVQVVRRFVLGDRAQNALGKWASVISSTVQQVIDELFLEHQARLQARSEQAQNDEEMQAELKKRYQEAF